MFECAFWVWFFARRSREYVRRQRRTSMFHRSRSRYPYPRQSFLYLDNSHLMCLLSFCCVGQNVNFRVLTCEKITRYFGLWYWNSETGKLKNLTSLQRRLACFYGCCADAANQCMIRRRTQEQQQRRELIIADSTNGLVRRETVTVSTATTEASAPWIDTLIRSFPKDVSFHLLQWKTNTKFKSTICKKVLLSSSIR